jgi:uncharacterized small protein (DUF1192 family)
MEEDRPKEAPDLTLENLGRQDLYTMSVADLIARIQSLKTEIARCEAAIESRNDTRSAADKLFRF